MLLTSRQRTLPRAHLRTGEADIPRPYSHGSAGYPPDSSWAAGGMGATLLNSPMAMEGTTSYRPISMGRTRNGVTSYRPIEMGATDDPAATAGVWKWGLAGLALGGLAGFLLAREMR